MKSAFEALELPAYWVSLVNLGKIDELIALYDPSAILVPTFSPHIIRDRAELTNYFTMLFGKSDLIVVLYEKKIVCRRIGEHGCMINGIYDFKFDVDGMHQTFPSRYTFVTDSGSEHPILHHHSSRIPKAMD